MLMRIDLAGKYDVPAPRYTSYPTVPQWEGWDAASWPVAVSDAYHSGNKSLDLYIHLPFCESLCTYCACNTRITKNHSVESPYLEQLLKEWKMYVEIIGEKPRISSIHLGGGTPTFFSPENLGNLINTIKENSIVLENAEMSFEAHPANTTSEHLQTLASHGFNRLSIGVQDFNPEVQRLIHRVQTQDQVQSLTTLSRILQYNSINFDLIYGLPGQTLDSISETINIVTRMRPDRIAFYSYAHVPWIRPGQRAYTDSDIPVGAEKRKLYETGRKILEDAGYIEIGLDHFALPGDELLLAAVNGKLHRNFMGYTTRETKLLIGLGVSAISDAGTMYAQNRKKLEEWSADIEDGKSANFRGHTMTTEDTILRKHIMNIMCKGETSWKNPEDSVDYIKEAVSKLSALQEDKLVTISDSGTKLTLAGRPFLRNAGLCFDARQARSESGSRIYSTTA
ncbi:oxygen-independent coproporphyrinogen III oxidase [soil metagenome]